MAEECLNFTINDFPPEIIEQFTPDLESKTISTLKLVSKKFYDVFKRDIFYKCYLIYPEEYYLEDLVFETKASNVKEIVESIKNRVYGKWEGFLRLEKAHLENLKNGRLEVDTVEIDYDVFYELDYGVLYDSPFLAYYELSDENNGRWLCCVFCNNKIILVNLATKQELRCDLKFKKIHVLPNLILLQVGDFKFAVYKLVNREGKCALQLQFKTSPLEEMGRNFGKFCIFGYFVMSGKSKSSSGVKNFVVEILRNKLGEECIVDCSLLVYNVESNTVSVTSYPWEQLGMSPGFLQFLANKFLSLVMELQDVTYAIKRLAVFDVETMLVTHSLDISDPSSIFTCVRKVEFVSSNILLIILIDQWVYYRLSPVPPGGVGVFEPIPSLSSPQRLFIPKEFFATSSVCVWQKLNFVHVLKFKGESDIHESKFSISSEYELVGIIQQDVIMLRSRYADFVEARTLTGKHLFYCGFEGRGLRCSLKSIRFSSSPSRFVLPNTSGKCYAKVYYF